MLRRACALAMVVGTGACGTLLTGDVENGPVAGADASSTTDGSDDALASDGEPADDGAGASDGAGDADGIAPADADADAAPLGCLGDAGCDRYVFVTSAAISGTFGGIAFADAKCQALADFPSSAPQVKNRLWRAWLSDDATNAADHVVHGTGKYTRVDGIVVADSFADLTDGTLLAAISIDEKNTAQTGAAWTGTQSNGGAVQGVNCGNWMSAAANGKKGDVTSSSGKWTDDGDQGCAGTFGRFYCFEY